MKGDQADIGRELSDAAEQRRRSLFDEARPEAVRRQHDLGKLTARERLGLLADPGTFHEIGGLVEPGRETQFTEGIVAPADGVITGTCKVAGRPVCVASFDFTVVGGSNGKVGGLKVARITEQAHTWRVPLVLLLDGGGHRIQEGLDSRHFAHGSGFFRLQAQLSGWVPVVAAILGPGFAGPSNFAALADFVVMRRGTSTMGIAGPALVRAATGEVVDKESLGGASVQADRQGIADLAVDSDEEAICAVQRFLSYLPGNAADTPPVEDCPEDEPTEGIVDLVPANPRRAYDMRKVLQRIADPSSYFELKPTYARNLVTAFARLGGRPVGLIANQPMFLAGALDSNACEKGAHFVSLCDAYGLALVYFVDVPGFLAGPSAEASGLARRSGRLIYELGLATVPRFSVVVRKGYGLAYIAMCGGRSFDADLALAWPTAEIAAMSLEGAVDVAYRREVQEAPDPAARREQLLDTFRGQLGALRAAEGFGVDDVIHPDATRRRLVEALGRAPWRRHDHGPPRRHGISPI